MVTHNALTIGAVVNPLGTAWPSQDIRLFIRGFCTSQYNSWHSTTPLLQPSTLYFAISIAQYMVFPLASFVCHSTYNIGNGDIVSKDQQVTRTRTQTQSEQRHNDA